MMSHSREVRRIWYIVGIVLSGISVINAQNCHKACSCKTGKVTCVGSQTSVIDNKVLQDIISQTPPNIIEFMILRAKLPTIGNVFAKFTKLETMGLMACDITNFAKDAFISLKTLINLHISDNPLKSFQPDLFKELTKLEVANFTHNQLETIFPNEFRGLVALKKLFLNKNQITRLDGASFHTDLKNLEILHINHNLLETITPDTFSPLTNLEVLDIGWQSPKLQLPPQLLLPLKKLRTLLMTDVLSSKNNTIPSGLLTGLDQLTGLDTRLNNLRSISGKDFEPVSKTLKRLYLGHNHFPILTKGMFNSLTKLEILDLYDCNVEKIEVETFENLTNLKTLNLQNNKLRTLTVDILAPVRNATILLRHNLLRCDCSTMEMYEWIKSEKPMPDLTCAEPPRLKHKKLYKLQKPDLRCVAPLVFSGRQQEEIRVEEHMTVSLKCRASSYDHFANMSYEVLDGNPAPNQTVIDVHQRKWTMEVNGETIYETELQIKVKEVSEDNSGKIKCIAWNKFGNSSGILKVHVYPQRWGIPLWALILILVIVFLLVFLCIGGLFYHYRYKDVMISQKFQSPARYSRQEDVKPVSAITTSTTALHPEYVRPEFNQQDYSQPGYGYEQPDRHQEQGHYNVAYLPEAPSMYVTYV